MRKVKKILFLVLLLAILVFNFLFKDRLMTRAAERGLEQVFGAQVDIHTLRFQLFEGRIALASLAVTDADEPAKNLFELGDMVIDLNMNQLLRRRFILEEAACRRLRFGTERKSPGRVNAAAGRRLSDRERPAAWSTGLSAAALVEKHLPDLKSPQKMQELKQALERNGAAWEARSSTLKDNLSQVQAAAAEVLALKAENLGSPEEAVRALQTLAQARDKLSGVAADLRQAGADFERDRQQAETALSAFGESLTADREALLALWELPAAEDMPALLFRRLLEPRLGRFSRYAVRALEAAVKLKKEKRDTERRRGREVDFPLQRYPRFLLRHLSASLEEGNETVSVKLWDIASDMELWGRPASVEAAGRRDGDTLQLAGTLDTRAGAARTLDLTLGLSSERTRIAIEGWPLLTGRHEFESSLHTDRDGRVAGSLRVRATVTAEQDGSVAPAGRVVMQGLGTATDLVMRGAYTVSAGGEMNLQVSSNLDELLVDIAAAGLSERGRELEQALMSRLAPEEAENQRLYAALLSYGTRLENSGRTAALLTQRLEERSGELADSLRFPGSSVLPEALKKLKLPGN
jgi:uncharacterized protein (TIGR03545 family)